MHKRRPLLPYRGVFRIQIEEREERFIRFRFFNQIYSSDGVTNSFRWTIDNNRFFNTFDYCLSVEYNYGQVTRFVSHVINLLDRQLMVIFIEILTIQRLITSLSLTNYNNQTNTYNLFCDYIITIYQQHKCSYYVRRPTGG